MAKKKKEQLPVVGSQLSVDEPAATAPEPTTNNQQPITTAKPPRLSGEQLKARMRQERRATRLAEKGY